MADRANPEKIRLEELTTQERRLIQAIRQGHIREALKEFSSIIEDAEEDTVSQNELDELDDVLGDAMTQDGIDYERLKSRTTPFDLEEWEEK